MPTQNPRLNLTLNDEIMKALAALAKKSKQTVSAVAKDLLEDALEMQEDIHFSRIANERDTDKSKWISSKDFWK
jgi:predicted DNA-binding protein